MRALRPFSNLLALHERDPRLAHELQAELESSREFARVSLVDGWIVASAPLAPTEPLPDGDAERSGLFFAEGRDRFATRADLERLAELTHTDPERLHRCAGDFTFLSLGAHGIRAVRACGGSVPLYYGARAGRTAVATRLGFFPRFFDRTLALDPLVAATWATAIDFFPDGRSLLRGVSVLERGHVLAIDSSGRQRIQRYWDPRPRTLPPPSPAKIREHAATLRTALLGSLEANLDPAGRNLLTLSGGVDSSSLAALTGKLEIPITTLSFLPRDQQRFERERPHVERALRAARVTHSQYVRLDATSWFELQRKGQVGVAMVVHPALCLLPEIVSQRETRVLFGGEFADVICGSTPTLKDWAAHTSLLGLLTRLRALPNGRSDVTDWLRYQVRLRLGRPYTRFPRQLGAMLHPAVRREYAAWVADRTRRVARDPLPRPALPLYTEQVGFVAQNWEVCSEFGVRRFFPFFTRELLELAYGCHPAELVGPGYKKILKQALSDLVPRETLERRDKGFWGPGLKAARLPWSEELDPELSPIIREDWMPKPPPELSFLEALALQALVNILAALRIRRQEQSKRR